MLEKKMNTTKLLSTLICLTFVIAFCLCGLMVLSSSQVAYASENTSQPDLPISQIDESVVLSATTLNENPEQSVTTANFRVHFDEDFISVATANAIASYFEEVKNTYLQWGYRSPILQFLKSRYQVYLYAGSDTNSAYGSGDILGLTTHTEQHCNVCATYISLYQVETLTEQLKNTIAHEYFHAIQNAYNCNISWLKEAGASWASYKVAGNVSNLDWSSYFKQQHISLETRFSTTLVDLYANSIWLFYIEQKYGFDAVRSIYEEYADYSDVEAFSVFTDIIEDAIERKGFTNVNFDDMYFELSAYCVDVSKWFDLPVAEGLGMIGFPKYDVAIESTTTTLSLNNYSTEYVRFFPTEFNHFAEIIIEGVPINGCVQLYTITEDNEHDFVRITPNENGSFVIDTAEIDEEVIRGIVIVSSAETQDVITVEIEGEYPAHSQLHYCEICDKILTSHSYHAPYVWVSSTQHSAVCDCGAIKNLPHAVRQGSNRCLLCGGIADQGFVQMGIGVTPSIFENGSYILPNGVIVLAPEDVTFFLRNTSWIYDLCVC